VTDRDAYIVLNLLPGIGSQRVQALIREFGSAAAILEKSHEELSMVRGIPAALAAKLANWQSETNLPLELELTDRGGARIITRADYDYPEILRHIPDPPLCLYVRGTLPEFDARTVAVVGSRRMSRYGRAMAAQLSEGAVYAGWKVISGLAYGVDAVAHQSTINAGGITVAVLGGGLAKVHPQDHIPLARAIIDHGGAVITEFPMTFPVSRQSFPRRNRIVSGLSRGVIVVEADIDSGAMITATMALEQGRTVFAVPGQVDNPQARGCHKLIREGACLTESFNDVLNEFEFLPGFSPGVAEEPGVYSADGGDDTDSGDLFNRFDPHESRVLEFLRGGERHFDDIAAETELPTGELLAVMMRLEVKMAVRQDIGRMYKLK
jgi:DNA processing protein